MVIKYIKPHIEWMFLVGALLAMGLMSPFDSGESFCLLERAGFPYCPGDGIGHSISHTFRGNFVAAIEAHFMGPFAVVVMSSRAVYLFTNNIIKKHQPSAHKHHG